MNGEHSKVESVTTETVVMDPALKAKWLEALRGGKYPQGKGYLHNDDGFCCLGVLAMVAGHELSKITGWACLESTDTALAKSIDDSDRSVKCALENMNDGVEGQRRHSFPEIADWIEVNL
jgi:hypothetical protein